MHNFKRNEILLVCEALSGALLKQEAELYPNQPLGEWVHEKIVRDQLDRKWHVKRDVLVGKLSALDSTQAKNLIEAAKRFQALREGGCSEDEALHKAGLG
jgi:hypothetical protein